MAGSTGLMPFKRLALIGISLMAVAALTLAPTHFTRDSVTGYVSNHLIPCHTVKHVILLRLIFRASWFKPLFGHVNQWLTARPDAARMTVSQGRHRLRDLCSVQHKKNYI